MNKELNSTIKKTSQNKLDFSRTTLRKMYRMKYYYILLLPALIYFILFHYLPMYGLVIAFKDYKLLGGILGSPWVGLDNFIRLFQSPLFLRTFLNTLIISFLKILFGFPAPIILALLLNEIKSTRYKKFVQSVSYLPHFISWVILGGIIKQFLSPSTGVLNYLLSIIGHDPIYFLVEPNYFRGIVIISHIWQSVGWGSILYLAAMASIPQEQYESAYIDGANRFKSIIYITIPSIIPVITILFLLNLSRILEAGFDQIFNLYNPMVYSVGDIIDTYAYRIGLVKYNYSFATAVTLFKNVIGFTLVVTVNKITNKFSENTLW